MRFLKNIFGNLTDLQKRIMFTLGALIVYRIGSFIPLPGVNASAVLHLFNGDNGMMGMFDMTKRLDSRDCISVTGDSTVHNNVVNSPIINYN